MTIPMTPISVRTILFTEACPLSCRYCDLKNTSNYGTKSQLTLEEIKKIIKYYDEIDDPKKITTRLLFTGGEPFLYWDYIKEIILQYGTRFQYAFNTSGYLFTEEILKFLSNYDVSFVLSVDGDEKLTNYLRPVNNTPYHTGYFKKLKSILPTLLYYFPKTPFRIIINPRYVDLLYSQYKVAEALGFKYFTFILDFESRPDRDLPNKIKWTDKDTIILQEQVNLIAQDILLGFSLNIKRPEVIEFNSVLEFLFKQEPWDPMKLPCQVFNGRSLASLYGKNNGDYCMKKYFPNIEDAKQNLILAYNELNHQCLKNLNCPAFEYCAYKCCPQACLNRSNKFFDFDELECVINKVCYYAMITFLSLCEQEYLDNTLCKLYLSNFIKEG